MFRREEPESVLAGLLRKAGTQNTDLFRQAIAKRSGWAQSVRGLDTMFAALPPTIQISAHLPHSHPHVLKLKSLPRSSSFRSKCPTFGTRWRGSPGRGLLPCPPVLAV